MVVAAGCEKYIDYLPRRFLKHVENRERFGVFPLWEVPRVLEDLQTSVDVTVARLDRLSGRLLFRGDYLAVPDWINSWLQVPEDLTAWARASHLHPSLLRDMAPEVSHERQDLERFYHEMYVPYIRRRHGEWAYVRSFYQMRRCFDRGGILWLNYRGRRAAGGLFQVAGKILRLMASGTPGGKWPPVKHGTMDALKYFEVEYARKIGCTHIDAGGSRPSLHDGVLRYKRKWGMNLARKLDSHHDWFVHWNGLTTKVRSFLSRSSLIFRDGDGLSAVAAIDREDRAAEADARRAHHLLWTRGLRRLYLIAELGWQPCASIPPHTVLLDAQGAARLFSGGPQPLHDPALPQ
jgi:hypothetical protein